MAGADEVFVVDGGSTDGTAAVAESSAARVLHSSPGRAVQMNLGAKASTGEVLLFLHADNWLEAGAVGQIREALTDEHVVAGAFRQRIESPGLPYRWIEWGNARRVAWWRMAYGDQGIFVRREVFEQLGGFAEVPFLEDVLFSRRVRGEGKVALLAGPLHVSARRWQKHGVVRQTLKNWLILSAHHFGVSPHRLAEFYRSHQ